jgi:hypothetical protein
MPPKALVTTLSTVVITLGLGSRGDTSIQDNNL